MKAHTVYDAATGVLLRVVMCPESQLAANVREKEASIEGDFDTQSNRVDLKTGEVVDYQPPQPSPDFEWDEDVKRWKLSESAVAVMVADGDARTAIKDQEATSLRAIRELLLNPDNTEARAKLQAVDDAIAAERPKIIVKGEISGRP